MSFGSVSERVMLARAMAARLCGTFTCTGEGGYPDSLVPYREHVITQIATGMFGVREETSSGPDVGWCAGRKSQAWAGTC
jgi:glutamate synthase domain-containing protein 2